MPWRLVQFIVVFVIFLLFIMFNLGNSCDINFGFTTFKDVPVFLTAFIAFTGGIIFSIPFILVNKFHKKDKPPKPPKEKRKKRKKTTDQPNEIVVANSNQYGID